jgi:hypothetical protein
MYDDDETAVLDELETQEAWEQLDYFSPTERRDLFRWITDIQDVDQTDNRLRSAREMLSSDRG